ncbi:MAG: hypothetical protein PHN45_09125 [Methylococcales bacterium]|nr:hypothetical protein [Methylococcales bacterium]MDD5754900.1 hypothetical protein [Methylococcales bacterium]
MILNDTKSVRIVLTKEDLENPSYDPKYKYKWNVTGGDEKQYIGHPDKDELNRHEGDEVIYFIDSLQFLSHSYEKGTEKIEQMVRQNLLKAERMIRQDLPSNLHSREKVVEWLRDNWSKKYPSQS